LTIVLIVLITSFSINIT